MTSPAVGASSPWAFHAHPDVWALVIALCAGYALALRFLAPTHAPVGRPPAFARQQLAFFAGVATLWFGADWPIHDISESYLFSVHMVQHLLFTFIAPPLLLLGMPQWLLRALIPKGRRMAIVRFLTRPLVALLVFNAVIAITHWPSLVDLSLRVELVHFAIHTVLFVTATLMWWPVVAPLSELARLSPPAKMLYLFLQSILPTVPASYLTFADTPFYSFYASLLMVCMCIDFVT